MLSAPPPAAPKARIAKIPHFRRAPRQPDARRDHAGDGGAVGMRAILAVERIERIRDRVGQFRMCGINAAVDDGDG